MRQYSEFRVTVGFDREPKNIFDEIDIHISRLFRDGWIVEDTIIDETLEYIDIICYKDLDSEGRD